MSELLHREATDPRLSQGVVISITDVTVSADLRNAHIYVSIMGGDAQVREAMVALRHATGFLRHELASRLTLRYVPEITFHLDESVERGARILELLKHIHDQEDRQSSTP
jgi:ribosome-binding factor A